ncbi:MAG: hypothetical protein ACC628_14525, partial [Pirellulaceae bacterium]
LTQESYQLAAGRNPSHFSTAGPGESLLPSGQARTESLMGSPVDGSLPVVVPPGQARTETSHCRVADQASGSTIAELLTLPSGLATAEASATDV